MKKPVKKKLVRTKKSICLSAFVEMPDEYRLTSSILRQIADELDLHAESYLHLDSGYESISYEIVIPEPKEEYQARQQKHDEKHEEQLRHYEKWALSQAADARKELTDAKRGKKSKKETSQKEEGSKERSSKKETKEETPKEES